MTVIINNDASILSGNIYNFDADINILVGGNGSGKSSLLKSMILSFVDNWELEGSQPLSKENITIENKWLSLGYFIAENNLKHKSYFGEDIMEHVFAMKSSSGQAVFNQVLKTISQNEFTILDEPDQSLDLKHILILERVFEVVSLKKGHKIIAALHNPFLLLEVCKMSNSKLIDVVTGKEITAEEYVLQQKLEADKFFNP